LFAPILDLARGFDRLGHNLSERKAGASVVGLDTNFFQMWAAQYWVSPGNRFVCGDADKPLPFVGDSFCRGLCSDAFHLFRNKAEVLEEIELCAPNRPVVLARVGKLW
jgi:SAM-dependent methyltransferase